MKRILARLTIISLTVAGLAWAGSASATICTPQTPQFCETTTTLPPVTLPPPVTTTTPPVEIGTPLVVEAPVPVVAHANFTG